MQSAFQRFKRSYAACSMPYALYFISFVLFTSLISVYLLDKGYKPSNVAVVVTGAQLASIAAYPFVGRLQDKYNPKLVNAILFVLAAIGSVVFMYARSFAVIALSYGMVVMLLNCATPVLEHIATQSRFPYGKIRVWGTVGAACGFQLGGVIYQWISPQALYMTFFITILLCAICMLFTANPTKPAKDAPIARAKGGKGMFRSLLKNRAFIGYLLLALIFYGVNDIGHTYCSAMYQAMGVPVATTSTIVLIACLCEGPVVFFASRFMDRLSNKTLLLAVYLLMLFQTVVYAFCSWLPLTVAATLITKHTTSMLFIMLNLKVVGTLADASHQITALSVVNTVRSAASILFQSIAGAVLDVSSYPRLYQLCSVVLAIGMLYLFVYRVPSGNDRKLFNVECASASRA